jgi:hypothetical protein
MFGCWVLVGSSTPDNFEKVFLEEWGNQEKQLHNFVQGAIRKDPTTDDRRLAAAGKGAGLGR